MHYFRKLYIETWVIYIIFFLMISEGCSTEKWHIVSHVVHWEFYDISFSQKLSLVEIHFSVIWSLYNVICAQKNLLAGKAWWQTNQWFSFCCWHAWQGMWLSDVRPFLDWIYWSSLSRTFKAFSCVLKYIEYVLLLKVL